MHYTKPATSRTPVLGLMRIVSGIYIPCDCVQEPCKCAVSG